MLQPNEFSAKVLTLINLPFFSFSMLYFLNFGMKFCQNYNIELLSVIDKIREKY